MQTKWLETIRKYDGSELHSLFAYKHFSLLGDSIIGFRGPCQVSEKFMIDGEDRFAHEKICGDDMLHFIVEKFPANLLAMVAIQRLMASLLAETLSRKGVKSVSRSGDDVFVSEGKLSISIATVSPVSGLIHFALNVSNSGTPVKTSSLNDFGLEPKAFALEILEKFATEITSVDLATRKVFPAHENPGP